MQEKAISLWFSTSSGGLRVERLVIRHPELKLRTDRLLCDHPRIAWNPRLRLLARYIVECAAAASQNANAKGVEGRPIVPIWRGTEAQSLYEAIADSKRVRDGIENSWQHRLFTNDDDGCVIDEVFEYHFDTRTKVDRLFLNPRRFNLDHISVYAILGKGESEKIVTPALDIMLEWAKQLRHSPAATPRLGALTVDPDVPRPMSDDEFHRFMPVDAYAYAMDGYDNAFLPHWRETFPRGMIGHFKNRKLIGGLGMWPVTQDAAKLLVSGGFKDESEIDASLYFDIGNAPTSFWYLGGAVNMPDAHHMAGRDLLRFGLTDGWLNAMPEKIAEPFTVIVMGVLGSVQRFCENHHFEQSVVNFLGVEVPVLHTKQGSARNEVRVGSKVMA